MMKQSIKNILPVLIVFLLINLACNFPTEDSTLRAPEITAVPPIQLEGEGESFFEQDPSSGRVTIVLTESDLTSYIAAEMEAQENPPLRNPRVLLRDGRAEVLGQAQTGPFESDIRLVMTVSVTTEEQLNFEVVSADFGPVPAPEQVRNQLSNIANDTFRRSIAPQMQGYRAESVSIDTGRITITAVPQ
jgi:hypothetical protein